MVLQAATALHQPLISYQAIFAIAHPRETTIPEIVFGVRQHSHFRLSAGCMVIRFSQFLTNLESLVTADRFGGKGTSANAGTVPGRNATQRVLAPSTLARGFRATRGNYCPTDLTSTRPGRAFSLRR